MFCPARQLGEIFLHIFGAIRFYIKAAGDIGGLPVPEADHCIGCRFDPVNLLSDLHGQVLILRNDLNIEIIINSVIYY